MNFKALSFNFNGKPSDAFNLYIMDFDNSKSTSSVTNGANVKVTQEFSARGSTSFLQAVTQHEPLKFTLKIGSPTPMDRQQIDSISRWLFGHLEPKKLEIIQDDMRGVYYNCFLTNPKNIYIADCAYGFSCEVLCDSPFAYERERQQDFYISNGKQNVIFNNRSSDNDYMRPKIFFQCNRQGGSVRITNLTDDGNVVEIKNLDMGEGITMDSKTNIITSTTGKRRLGNTNYNFLKFLPEMNKLTIEGDLDKLTVIYQNMRKVGG